MMIRSIYNYRLITATLYSHDISSIATTRSTVRITLIANELVSENQVDSIIDIVCI